MSEIVLALLLALWLLWPRGADLAQPANPWWREDADEARVRADRVTGQSAWIVEE